MLFLSLDGTGKNKGGLRLDSQEAAMNGGDSGPVILPGEPEKSLLIKAVRYQDQDMQMPPKSQLTQEQVAELEEWIKMGAPWPKKTDIAKEKTPAKSEEQKQSK